jgi:hypothetical protein
LNKVIWSFPAAKAAFQVSSPASVPVAVPVSFPALVEPGSFPVAEVPIAFPGTKGLLAKAAQPAVLAFASSIEFA